MKKTRISNQDLNETYDDIYAEHYDLLNQHKSYKEETIRLDELLTSLSVSNDVPIIDIGCGTGNHAINLSSMRANPICGFDTSSAMINRAISKGSSVHFSSGEMIRITNQRYGFAFSLFNVVNCIKTIGELAQFFSNINRILLSGSYFFFEFWNKDLVTKTPPSTVIRKYSLGGKEFTRTAKPDNSKLKAGKLELNYQVEIVACNGDEARFTRIHDLTLYSASEIEDCLKDNGFQIQWCRGSLPELSLSTSNARMTSILAKKNEPNL